MTASAPSLLERAAAAIANVRGARRGVPEIANVLELLPPRSLEELLEEARAALEATGTEELREAAGLALLTLEELGEHTGQNGQPWRDAGSVWRATVQLHKAIDLADGQARRQEPPKEGGQA